MKKATLIFTTLLLLSFFFTSNVNAQKFSDLDVSPMDIAAYPTSYRDSNKQIKIIYSRPQLKERSLSKLAPNGTLWRTGANEATELVLYQDFNLGDAQLNAGTYTLATIPGEKEWIIIINSDLNTWGAYFYDEANDVARISVPVSNGDTSIEAFSIAFTDAENGVDMHLAWDRVRVVVPFKN